MHNIGPDILGSYDAVPPPGAEVGLRLRPKRLLKRVGKVAKKAGRVAKKGAKVATYAHRKALKTVAKAGKFAARKLATVAAIPIRRSFRTLAMRRAKLLSWQGRKSMAPNATEKRSAAAWALARMSSKGPIGKFGVKVLKFTRGATLGDLQAASARALGDTGEVLGLTGAEIAAAAAAVVAAVTQITRSLNKPGEAPADPRQAEPEASPDEPSEAPSDDEGEESSSGWAGAGNALALLGSLLGTVIARAPSDVSGPKKARRYPPPPPPAPQDLTRESAARDGMKVLPPIVETWRPLKKAYRNRRQPTY